MGEGGNEHEKNGWSSTELTSHKFMADYAKDSKTNI